jgi:hypothetical protein
MTNKHTALPWRHVELVNEDGSSMSPEDAAEYVANTAIHGSTGFHAIHATKGDGKTYDVCHVGNGPDSPWNAATIAVAVNYHDRLREALGDVVDEWVYGDDIFGPIQKARALLAELDNLEGNDD